jgi:hypothetical protein
MWGLEKWRTQMHDQENTKQDSHFFSFTSDSWPSSVEYKISSVLYEDCSQESQKKVHKTGINYAYL